MPIAAAFSNQASEAMRVMFARAQQVNALEQAPAGAPRNQQAIGDRVRMEEAKRALDEAVGAYNALRPVGSPAFTAAEAMRVVVDRTLAALGGGEVMFDRATDVMLRGLAEDPWLHTRELLGDIFELVRKKAGEEGLEVVTPSDAIRILREAADPAKNPQVHRGAYSLASDGKRGHMESAIAVARCGGDAHRWLEGFAQQHIKDLHRALEAPNLSLASLRKDGLEEQSSYQLWARTFRMELARISELGPDARRTALAALKEDFELVLPKRTIDLLVPRAAGDQAAFGDLERAVETAIAQRATLSTPRDLPPGLAALQMPVIDLPHLYKWSGDTNYHINLRNMAYGWPNLGDEIRLRAYHASTRGEPLRILELTHGLPRTAIDFTSEGAVRREGDHLLCGTINGDRAPLVKWERPAVASMAITPKDMIADYIRGDRTPAKFNEWYDRDMAWSFANKDRASSHELADGYARMKREGKLDVREGELAAQLREVARSGKKVDIAFFHELAWTKNRVEVLEALQGALKPGGRAFIPLEWWSPRGMEGDGVKDHLPFADTVTSGGREISLAKFLAERFPDHFEVDKYESCLVVKGTHAPVRLPKMDAAATGDSVRHGFPVLRWTLIGDARA